MKNKQFAFWKANLLYFAINSKEYRGLKKNFNQNKYNDFCLNYVKYILKTMNVEIEIEGEENLVDGAFYLSNHGSMFDSYISYAVIKKNLSYFIAGDLEYAMKIPIAKNILKWTNAIFVDRSSLKTGIKAIKAGEEQLEKGNNLYIFPEGEVTNILTEGKKIIGDFHPGSFKAAKNKKAIVVPITIIGSDKIHKTNSLFSKINSAKVKVIIHKPLHEFQNDDEITTREMALKTHEMILKTLKIYQKDTV